MKKIDNKGFTLVELIATLVILSIVVGIGSYAITDMINTSKEEEYKLLLENIRNGVEEFYLECKYMSDSTVVTCPSLVDGYYNIKLGDLVTYGYLKGNSVDNSNDRNYTLVNPNDDGNIANCEIKFAYNDGDITIEAVNPSGSCPTDYTG